MFFILQCLYEIKRRIICIFYSKDFLYSFILFQKLLFYVAGFIQLSLLSKSLFLHSPIYFWDHWIFFGLHAIFFAFIYGRYHYLQNSSISADWNWRSCFILRHRHVLSRPDLIMVEWGFTKVTWSYWCTSKGWRQININKRYNLWRCYNIIINI